MKYIFDGDLNQMFEQKKYLKSQGFDVKIADVYPYVETEEEYEKALKLIYENSIPGWWHYLGNYEEYKICTKKEFSLKLEAT